MWCFTVSLINAVFFVNKHYPSKFQFSSETLPSERIGRFQSFRSSSLHLMKKPVDHLAEHLTSNRDSKLEALTEHLPNETEALSEKPEKSAQVSVPSGTAKVIVWQ